MTYRRGRRVGVAAIAFAAVALLPGSAGAHQADCSTGLAEAPTTDRLFAAWKGCESAATSRGDDRTASRARATQGERGSFKQVGRNPLKDRGMNAAIAIHEDYAYIGSRTDGSHAGQPQGGIMVVDISRPSRPKLLTDTPIDAKPGESSRELRVWQSQDILIVLNTNCGAGPTLHHCSTTEPEARNFRFYDISGRNAQRPRLITQMDEHTHEFFLWEDPNDPSRALMFGGNAGSTCGEHPTPSCPFAVWDISPVLRGEQPETLFSGLHGFTRFPADPALPVQKPTGGLHSLSVSNDGSTAYFALLTGGFAVTDVSDFAAGRPAPQPRPITFNESRPTWRGPGAHSAAKLWGRDWVWVSDEVYGTATGSAHGCPWGWARMVDITDPTRPTVEAAYRIDENDPDICDVFNPPRTSYSAHNPTLTPNIAFSTWHSGGMQAVGIEKPWRPYQLAEFFPRPLRSVLLEDPRLSSDPDTGRNEKVVMWSYAIIKDGLIYVVDLRNGLYVLEYRGQFDDEVSSISYLDGNSNQGDALCFEPVGRAPRHCD
jgi:hypothetical protein